MRVLFLGDIVGRAARNAVIAQLADLRQDLAADFAVVNCENAAGVLASLRRSVMICFLRVQTC